MKAGQWCITSDDDNWMDAPGFDTLEQAVEAAPSRLALAPGAHFWVAQAFEAGSRLSAEAVVDMLDSHASDEGPEGGGGYVVTTEAREELDALLDGWAKKHDVRPLWFAMENAKQHTVPK